YTSSTKDRFCTTRRSKRIRTAPVICGGPGRGAQYEALNAARADRRYWLYWATSAARTAEARLPAACITPPPKRGPNTLRERGHWRPRSVTKHVGGTGRRRWGDPLRRLNSRHVRHSRGRLSINEHGGDDQSRPRFAAGWRKALRLSFLDPCSVWTDSRGGAHRSTRPEAD